MREAERASVFDADFATESFAGIMSIADELLDCEGCRAMAHTPPSKDVGTPHATGYRVREGDSLVELARGWGMTLCQLLQHNPHINPYAYKAGEELQVPSKQVACPAGALHAVRPGDTLDGIARALGVASVDIARANPDTPLETLLPGQVICLPGGMAPDTAAIHAPAAPATHAAPEGWRATAYRKR